MFDFQLTRLCEPLTYKWIVRMGATGKVYIGSSASRIWPNSMGNLWTTCMILYILITPLQNLCHCRSESPWSGNSQNLYTQNTSITLILIAAQHTFHVLLLSWCTRSIALWVFLRLASLSDRSNRVTEILTHFCYRTPVTQNASV